ncbi:MAG: aspartyl protease family protein [Ekhidna sp.]
MKKVKINLWIILVMVFLGVGVLNASYRLRSLDGGILQADVAMATFSFENHVILTDVYIDGEGPFNFMVDTGLYPSQISLTLAKRLGLDIKSRGGNVLGAGTGNLSYYPTRIKNAKVGSLKIDDLEAIAVEMQHFQGEGKELHGMLGYSFLKNRVTTIDYKKQEMRFYTEWPKDFWLNKNREESVAFPLKLAGGKIPEIPNLKVNGQPLNALIDTGCNIGMILSHGQAARLSLPKVDMSGMEAKAEGTRGQFSIVLHRIDKLSLGSLEQDSVIVASHGQGLRASIGNAFLKEYMLTLDYVNRRVYVVPEE